MLHKNKRGFRLSFAVALRRHYHIKLFYRAYKITINIRRLFTDDRTARRYYNEIALFDLIFGFKRAIRLADQTLCAISLDRAADLL